MAAPLILARTFKDAHAFAQNVLGLRFGYYRVVNSAGTIKAVRNVDLYLVPGWDKRPDRFTMKSAIKWSRQNIIDVSSEFVEVDGVLTTRGCAEAIAKSGYPNDEKTHTIALRYNRLRDLPVSIPTITIDAGAISVDKITPGTISTEQISVGLVPDTSNGDNMVAEGSPDTTDEPEVPAEPVEKPKARRRRKCKNCEQMHYKDEPCAPEAD